ncbi:MAG: sensor histidine kinase [Faecalibacterium sp.]|jgi:two-component system sensor histidine kinase YesM|nr:sensor histidine kinase [Faecalibacterium sp.]
MYAKIRDACKKLSVKVFALMLVGLVLPSSVMMLYMRYRYESYIQTELSDRTIQNLQKSEQEILILFQRMVNISSVVANDKDLAHAMQDDAMDRYDKTKCFDKIVQTIETNNLYDMEGIRITVFDRQGQVYANWSTNYHDYSFLYQQDWVQRSIRAKGHVTWNLFAPAYVIEENGSSNYISLARSILAPAGGTAVATEIISVEQGQLNAALRQYATPEDFTYICTPDGNVVLKLDDQQVLSDAEAAALAAGLEAEKNGSHMVTENGKKYLMSYYTLSSQWSFEGKTLQVMQFTAYDAITGQMAAISGQIRNWIVFCLCILIFMIALIVRAVVRPISLLSRKMEAYRLDDELVELDFRRRDEIGQLNRSFRQMSATIRTLIAQAKEEAQERERYRFEALRAQVNPHFLFNTLNMIRWMAIIRHADNIVDSIDALATMLKYSMNRGGELVHLREEIANIQSYIFIQNCRYGDRILLETDLDEELLELPVIKFILQPIVENAVIHGFRGSDKAGKILIYGDQEKDTLQLFVEDNGIGMEADILDRVQKHRSEKKVTGIGIANVDARIRSAYGDAYGLTVQSTPGRGTVIAYKLPALKEAKLDEENSDCR